MVATTKVKMMLLELTQVSRQRISQKAIAGTRV